MDKEEIIKLAREAGLDPDLWNYTDAFERFAALVAKHEREACARVCERMSWPGRSDEALWRDDAAEECAKAIRARSEK